MAKRVSADTITEITTSPGFRNPAPIESTPTPEQLTEVIRQELAERVERAKAARAAGLPPPDGDNLWQLERDQKRFEDMIKEVPQGFRLVPVLYARVDAQAKQELTHEYSYHVRPRFLKFLAENHADELRKLGICEAGIERMRGGLDPADEQGNLYSVNVDHIIERNGSGLWGAQREADPDQPGFAPVFHPNHFGNFILLPEKIHEFKNLLNDVQNASETPRGQNKWILMMVPERNEQMSGFVCPPQDPSHRLHGLDLRPQDDFKKIEHGEYVLSTTLAELAEFKEMGKVRETVRGLIAEAERQRMTVAELAALQAQGKKRGSLSKTFNEAVDPQARTHVDNLVRPALKEITGYVGALFNQLSAKTETPKERAAFWKFARFFRSQNMRDLQSDVEALPLPEAHELSRSFRRLSREITQVCDRLDAEAKAAKAAKPPEPEASPDSAPDFRPEANDNKPGMVPLPPRKPSAKPLPPEGRPKRTFGRPGHFGGR